ncbi:RidA family protein [Ancylobacter sp. Lp-2]|uniref:RidA family protein n=1 Tax=Ancylobacter sp. Lp-2 TaxID=2881339 RepID=UPI001E4829FC|nr:RidA family protein [Ancylobacter sp. Lp-2]MCB4771025.1 RidA family protein [Ancylobacter sp. Lp-2]
MSIERYQRTAIFHRAVVHGGFVFLSGIVAQDGTADMTTQTEQVLDRLETYLREAGSSIGHVVSATIFLTDMADKATMNEVWKRRFAPHELPARATVGVSDLDGPYRLEVSAIAAAS